MNDVRMSARTVALPACVLAAVLALAATVAGAAESETRSGASPATVQAGMPARARASARAKAQIPASATSVSPPHGVGSPTPSEPPHHSFGPGLDFGGEAELRLGHDRVLGVGNPDLLSVSRVNGFAAARLGSRLELEGAVSYDRATDDVIVERALLALKLGASRRAQAGVLPLPLLEANLHPDATAATFAERSLVATALIGVPSSQFGLGVRGFRPRAGGSVFAYELDVVSGYDDGVINEAPDGTRVPAGRSGFARDGHLPALVGRATWHTRPGQWFGFAAYGGQYNRTTMFGARVDRARYLGIATGEAAATYRRFDLSAELAAVAVDVPPGIADLFASVQTGGALEVRRTLREPLLRAWRRTSLEAAMRAEVVDFDTAVMGDSRERVSFALNLRQQPRAVFRLDRKSVV